VWTFCWVDVEGGGDDFGRGVVERSTFRMTSIATMIMAVARRTASSYSGDVATGIPLEKIS
jgi:hypothetical protein